MQKEHRDIVAKLQFVLQLVDSLMSLAASRGSALALMLSNTSASNSARQQQSSQVSFLSPFLHQNQLKIF